MLQLAFRLKIVKLYTLAQSKLGHSQRRQAAVHGLGQLRNGRIKKRPSACSWGRYLSELGMIGAGCQVAPKSSIRIGHTRFQWPVRPKKTGTQLSVPDRFRPLPGMQSGYPK